MNAASIEQMAYVGRSTVRSIDVDTGEVVVTAGVQALHPGQKIRLLGSEP